jgi:hypothetical protein
MLAASGGSPENRLVSEGTTATLSPQCGQAAVVADGPPSIGNGRAHRGQVQTTGGMAEVNKG